MKTESDSPTPPRLQWVWSDDRHEWNLKHDGRTVATVWDNGYWHTWDHQGIGGENSVEETVKQAKIEAASSAIEQGFI